MYIFDCDINNGVHHGNEDDLKSTMVEYNN